MLSSKATDWREILHSGQAYNSHASLENRVLLTLRLNELMFLNFWVFILIDLSNGMTMSVPYVTKQPRVFIS